METITWHDGTTIAFDRYGDGPALILVEGALQHRAFDASTAALEGQGHDVAPDVMAPVLAEDFAA